MARNGYEFSNSMVVDSGSTSWYMSSCTAMVTRTYWNKDDDEECADTIHIIYRDAPVVKMVERIVEVPVTKTIYVEKEVPMNWNVSTILGIVVISVLASKLILPRVTLKNFAKVLVRCVLWPFRIFSRSLRAEMRQVEQDMEKGGDTN